MNLTFFGAAGGEVTGSSTLLQTGQARVLVDFGMFQGSRSAELRNVVPEPLRPADLDAVLVTHAHLDHVGRLPLLAKAGYRGAIHATPATIDLAEVILQDSAKIHLSETARENRKRMRAGIPPQEPLYTDRDVEKVLSQFKPLSYQKNTEIARGVVVRAVEAGHMLGSASFQVTASDATGTRVILFSGDVGPQNLPILRDAIHFDAADAIVLESTYGDRDHRPLDETLVELHKIVSDAVAAKGRILIPSFAVGRTQQILYHLARFFADGSIKPFPIFLDSPMASKANAIYKKHPELYDEEAVQFISSGQMERHLGTFHATASAQESQQLNNIPGPCVIIAGAGMCNAGRIVHHLKHGLWRHETHVCFVGYQAEGTLGRRLVDGARMVKIFGEPIQVNAHVHTIGGLSAHAGRSDLLAWIHKAAQGKARVLLNHGEARARTALAEAISERHGIVAELPQIGTSIDL